LASVFCLRNKSLFTRRDSNLHSSQREATILTNVPQLQNYDCVLFFFRMSGISLPLLGQAYLLDPADTQKTLHEFGRKLGGIFFIDLGPKRSAVITDYKLITQVGIMRTHV
jgi:hypothetical protein